MSIDEPTQAMPIRQVIARGFAAAHSVLLGALLVFLLHAPSQVLSAVAQSFQSQAFAGPNAGPDPTTLILYLTAALGGFLFALAVFFLFPLVQGGILGQVRDRIEHPHEPPGGFGPYARAFYLRLLGSQGMFALFMFAIMAPMMCVGMSLAFREMTEIMNAAQAEGAPGPQPLDSQQLTRQLYANPIVLTGMAISSILMAVVAMVYWIANCVVVSERQPVLASWRQSLRFCRQNVAVMLVMVLCFLGVGFLISPLSLVGQLGIVKNPWVLGALALVNCAIIGYGAVLLAGLSMSLYVARRLPSQQKEPELATVV